MKNLYQQAQRSLHNNKSLLLRCIIITVLIGLVAHAYMFFNNSFSHDSLSEFAGAPKWKASIGRVFVPLYMGLFRGPVALPLLIGVLGLLFLGAAVFLTVKLFNATSTPQIVLVAGILTVNISVIALIGTYIQDFDCNMFAMLLTVLAAFCFQRYRFGFLFGALPLAISLGLYQGFVSVTIVLLLFLLIFDCLHNLSVKEIVAKGFRAIGMLLLAGVLYFVFMKLLLLVMDVAVASGEYNSVNTALSMSITDFIKAILAAIKLAVKETAAPVSVFSKPVNLIIHGCLFLFSAVCLLRTAFLRKIGIIRGGLIGVCLLLLPLAMNICHVLTNNMSHQLMHYAFNLFYLFVMLMVYDQPAAAASGRNISFATIVKPVCMLLIVIVLFGNMRLSNLFYLAKDAQYDAELSYFTALSIRMDAVEGYEPGKTNVALCGGDRENTYLPKPYEQIVEFTGGNTGSTHQNYYWYLTAFMNYSLLRPDIFINPKDAETWDSVKEMPIYPAEGSLKMIDDILVVKIGE